MSSDGASVRIFGGHHAGEEGNSAVGPREPGFYEALKQQQEAEQQGRRGERELALIAVDSFFSQTLHC